MAGLDEALGSGRRGEQDRAIGGPSGGQKTPIEPAGECGIFTLNHRRSPHGRSGGISGHAVLSLVTGIDFGDGRAVLDGAAAGRGFGFHLVSMSCCRQEQASRSAKGNQTGKRSNAVHGSSR
jgi:hypothetical protein